MVVIVVSSYNCTPFLHFFVTKGKFKFKLPDLDSMRFLIHGPGPQRGRHKANRRRTNNATAKQKLHLSSRG